ncbi:hypothetical protein [Flavobacterium silvaticum]|uniref:Repeat protein (TIGR03806 family) n=1 Tax=Flavobacterium silvaticum TaxID=1852020 RepID=A0A972JJ95_9FLAO|nr:hypothetical protein [Flavobacterium silvaticum]NMH27987.1 hypothetical protein [Flavobacterium silvaticum]
MKKNYALAVIAFVSIIFLIFACSDSEDETTYIPVEPVSPVTVDLTQVPYPKLSDYKFFEGDMKDQVPALDVLPYEPSSALFTDYAHKKRFIWMPKNTKATYNGDEKALELPVGAALIKTFYYDNVQNIPVPGQTRIIETRIIIRKAEGYIFADYVWNEDQTEAYYDMAGSGTTVTWLDDDNVSQTAQYRIPNESQCIVCHKIWTPGESGEITTNIPIGIKPQNLNFNYNYGSEVKNQLTKWIEYGYLEDNFSLPSAENTVVNYNDTSQPIALRARAYFDSNCSHCHEANRHCDYRPMRFAYGSTAGNGGEANMGVCVNTQDMQGFPPELGTIVTPRHIEESMLYFRLNTTDETYRMPLHGRTMIHQEGIALVEEWINSLEHCD